MNILKALRPLFVARASTRVQPKILSGTPGTGAASGAPEPASPVFLTPQSLASFPGAALAINILWKLVAVVDANFAKRAIVPLALAFLVGAVIFIISYDGKMPRKAKIVGVFIALINSAWLGLNALGIDIFKPPTATP
jgi:hypothetical protein